MPLDRFEILKIQEIIALLADMKYFSCIDLKTGFVQVPIKPVDKEKTTFFYWESIDAIYMQATRL